MTTARRGLGYRPSPPGKLGTPRPAGLFKAGELPPAFSNRSRILEVLTQGDTSSCVAHSVAQQIRAALVGHGALNPPLPSRLFIYYGARRQAEPNESIVIDDGTFLHAAYEAMHELGFPPEHAWEFSELPAKINAQPDWEAMREAHDQRWLAGYYRIVGLGSTRIHAVKAALAAGHCVAWGTAIDDAFDDLTPGKVWPGVTGPAAGGHATLIVGYRPGAFEVCNSWGPDWCDEGFCLVSEAAVASENATDFWAASVAPNFTGTA